LVPDTSVQIATVSQRTKVGLQITDATSPPNGALVLAQVAPRPKIRRVDLKTGRIKRIVKGR
jgi:hypothetical protein